MEQVGVGYLNVPTSSVSQWQETKPDGLTTEFGYANAALSECVVDLRDRLNNVLTPEYDSNEAPMAAPAPIVSGLRNELHALQRITSTLRAVLDRVEA